MWLQSSSLGLLARRAGPNGYALINLTHVLGIATLFGPVLMLDLRLLGFWRRVPLLSISTIATPLARIGFAVAAISGALLLAGNATDYAGNPLLLVKFPAIGLALLNVFVLERTEAWRTHRLHDISDAQRRQLSLFGGVSLACWLTAISAGRLIAYW